MAGETTGTPEKKGEATPQPEVIKPYCPVTVEPIIFLVSVAAIMTGSLRQQYIYYRIGNGTVNRQGSSCYGNSSNSSAYQERQGDQAAAIQWGTALQLANFIPSLVVTVMIGSVSDKLGRKLNLIIPIVGCLLRFILAAFVVQFNLPLALLIPALFIYGLGGGYTTLTGGSYAYISDITLQGTSRYFRHAILQSVLGVAGIVGALGGNFWFRQLGFPTGISQPYWFSVGVSAFCLIYTIFAIKETCPSKPGSQLCKLSNITGIVQLFRAKRKTPRWPIGVLCLTQFLLHGTYTALNGIVSTYLVGPPFCFPPDFIGYFQAAIGAGFFASMVVIKPFSNYPYGLMAVGYASGVGCMVLLGLAPYTPNLALTVFMSAVAGCVQSASNVLLKSVMSKMVGPEEQGSLFGLTSFATSLAGVVFVPLWNFVYSSTLVIMPGLVFFVLAGVILVCAMLTAFVKFKVPEMVEENLVREDKEEHDITKL